ncbi:MAG TPA: GNAT family N-acetyltransferase [Acidobacteriota bacterium]|nr:GNAT family N-acetyltransferase [Acidobacteriota bacterium]
MEKTVSMKDGTEVLIREMSADDVDRSLAFFEALPEEDKTYLRRPLTDRETVVRRIQMMATGGVTRLVAIVDDQIVADGALELEGHGWKEHVGEIRLIVARPFQRRGLGRLMARELYMLASSKQVEELVVKIMGPQVGVRRMFKRLGFHKEAKLHDYVRDIRGIKHDLIVMRCKLQELWNKLGELMTESDWRRAR